MLEVVIGNVCALGAILSDSLSGAQKTKQRMLLIQCVSQIFYIISSLVLRAYSATAQNVVAIFRNWFAARGKSGKVLTGVFIILPVVLGIAFNNRGAMGLLPVIGNLEYSVAMFAFPDGSLKLKLAFILNAILFCVFNFAVLNFVGGIGCVVITAVTLTSVLKEKKERN